MKRVLNKYLNIKTGEIFFIWENEREYVKRDSMKYKQLSYSLEEYKKLKEGSA